MREHSFYQCPADKVNAGVAKRYGPLRDPRASLPVTSLQSELTSSSVKSSLTKADPIDLTRSDSEEVSGPPVPPVPPAGPTAPVNAPVIPAEATQSPHKRRRARHAKKTINAGVTEERMKAAAKRLADSLERVSQSSVKDLALTLCRVNSINVLERDQRLPAPLDQGTKPPMISFEQPLESRNPKVLCLQDTAPGEDHCGTTCFLHPECPQRRLQRNR